MAELPTGESPSDVAVQVWRPDARKSWVGMALSMAVLTLGLVLLSRALGRPGVPVEVVVLGVAHVILGIWLSRRSCVRLTEAGVVARSGTTTTYAWSQIETALLSPEWEGGVVSLRLKQRRYDAQLEDLPVRRDWRSEDTGQPAESLVDAINARLPAP